MRVAIIGAGPAGLTAAYCLSKILPEVDVYEASDSVGGLAKSFRLWNQTVDLGPHRFFSKDRRVNELWLQVAGRDYSMVDRLTRILYQGKFYNYPLQTTETLLNLGPIEAVRCLLSYGRERLQPTQQTDTFETWVCSRFGRRLFEIFFKTYSEKLWGLQCDELDSDFAAQRIKKFSLAEAIKSALSDKRKANHRTLVDQFAYPHGGTGMIYTRMEQSVRNCGGNVFLKTPIQRVVAARSRIHGIELADGTFREYDRVISTMPLTILVSRLPEAPPEVIAASRQLTFRNTILVYLEVAKQDVCPDNWIYVHSPELLTGRITNFRNWVPHLYGDNPNTILALEYWCNETDEFWRRDEAGLVQLARRELVAAGLVEKESLILNGKVYRIPRCYPVYRRGYKSLVEPIQEYLSTIRGLHVIGRYGAFKYNNQDHSILMGMLAAENILADANHDLWGVNSDYESYQESSSITEAGLVTA